MNNMNNKIPSNPKDTDRKKKIEVPWKKSKAKEILTILIMEGEIDESTNYAEVYYGNPEFQNYPKENFRTNMKNLITALRKKENWAEYDMRAAVSDEIRFPRPQLTSRGIPYWDTSKAATILKQDVKQKVHESMKMIDFYESNESYKEFPYQIFRKHVHQEINSQLKKSFFIKKDIDPKKWV